MQRRREICNIYRREICNIYRREILAEERNVQRRREILAEERNVQRRREICNIYRREIRQRKQFVLFGHNTHFLQRSWLHGPKFTFGCIYPNTIHQLLKITLVNELYEFITVSY